MILLQLSILAALMVIVVQDISVRAVYWWIFPVLSALFLTWDIINHIELFLVFSTIAGGSVILLLQYFLITLFFSWKEKRFINLLDGYIGIGDVLFLISISCYLTLESYFFFYVLSLLIILIGWIIWLIISKVKEMFLPLAGLQALLLIMIMTIDWWVHPLLANNKWLLEMAARL